MNKLFAVALLTLCSLAHAVDQDNGVVGQFYIASTAKSVPIETFATDDSGLDVTQKLYIDNVLKLTIVGPVLKYTWNVKGVKSGTHLIRVVTIDQAGNTTTSTMLGIK